MRTNCPKAYTQRTLVRIWPLIGLVVLLGLSGCKSLEMPTPRSVEAEAPTTLTPCPPPPTTTVLDEQHEPALLVVLVDKSGSYVPYTDQAIKALTRILPIIVGPGDRVLISWIGSSSDQPTSVIVDTQLPPLPPISYPATPTPPTLVTFIPQPTEISRADLSTMGQIHGTATAMTQATHTAATATTIAHDNAQLLQQDACARSQWATHTSQLWASWDAEQRARRRDFEATLTPALGLATQPSPDQSTRISAALLLISKVFHDERQVHAFQRYHLLIFSDMIEVGASYVEETEPINLTGVQMTVGMQACETEIVCKQVEAEWRERLNDANAEKLTFLRVIQSTDDAIRSQLR